MSQPERYYDQVEATISRIVGSLSWSDLCTELSNLDNPLSDQELSNNECGVVIQKALRSIEHGLPLWR